MLPKLPKKEISDIKSAIGRIVFGVDEDLDSWVFALKEILIGLLYESIGVIARDEEESIFSWSKVVKEVFFTPGDRSISEEFIFLQNYLKMYKIFQTFIIIICKYIIFS